MAEKCESSKPLHSAVDCVINPGVKYNQSRVSGLSARRLSAFG